MSDPSAVYESRMAKKLQSYLGRDEHIVFETRQHPMAILGAFIEAILWLTPLAITIWALGNWDFFVDGTGRWLRYILIAAMFGIVLRLFVHIVGWEYDRLIITNHKVIHVYGILNRKIDANSIAKVTELSVNQPLIGRMIGYGALEIDTAGGGSEPLHGLRYVPDPTAVYRTIADVAQSGGSAYRGDDGLGESLPRPHDASATTTVLPQNDGGSETPPAGQ